MNDLVLSLIGALILLIAVAWVEVYKARKRKLPAREKEGLKRMLNDMKNLNNKSKC